MFRERAGTAAVLIPLVVAAVLWAPALLVAGLIAVVLLFALEEFFTLSEAAGLGGYRGWTELCALWLVAIQWQGSWIPQSGWQGRWQLRPFLPEWADRGLFLLTFLLGLGLLVAAGRRPVGRRWGAAAASAGALLLVAWPFSCTLALLGYPHGRALLLLLLVVIWAGDTAAYLVGRRLGRHALSPSLSPAKTWEGAVAHVAAAGVVAGVATRWLSLAPGILMAMAIAASIAGQIGDLVESAYKRAAGVKDSSHLLPGHGGMLDRVDSLIFAAPVFWQAADWLTRSGRL